MALQPSLVSVSSLRSHLSLELSVCIAGALVSQLLIGRVPEHTMFTSLLLLYTSAACVIQFIGIGSAAVFFTLGLPLFVALVVSTMVRSPKEELSLWSYAIGQFTPLTIGSQIIFTTLDVFVPLVSIGGSWLRSSSR